MKFAMCPIESREYLLDSAMGRLASARISLQRYAQLSGGEQTSRLYHRFVRDVRSAAREYMRLEYTFRSQGS